MTGVHDEIRYKWKTRSQHMVPIRLAIGVPSVYFLITRIRPKFALCTGPLKGFFIYNTLKSCLTKSAGTE
jgi:hypothetical protein